MADYVGMTQAIADRANQNNSLTQDILKKIEEANKANGTADKKSASGMLNANFDTFIKMLTTQLQNQDPLEPTDTSQFTQQLVMYSQVEQQIGTNTKLDNVVSAITGNSANSYVDYIGKSVAAVSDSLVLYDKKSTVSYNLPDNAKSVKVEVLDKNKNVVATLNGAATVGDHNVNWDGKNNAGVQMGDGVYTFKVTALKEDGTALANVKQFAVAYVTAIRASSSGTQLELNGILKVDPSTIQAIGT